MRPSFFKDLSIPAVAAPMFLISCPKLVIECCKNGIVGTLPALNQKTTKGFEEWIIEIKEALSKYGSSSSGASLGEILGSVLKKQD